MSNTNLTYRELEGLCGGLALLLHAGVSLSDGLFLMAEEETGGLKPLISSLGQDMDSGMTLSASMEKAAVFPAFVTGMVRVGERTGRTEEALSGLAGYYRERERVARQVRSALAYPSVIMLIMLAVIGVLLIKVLPVFDEVYASLGGRLTGLAGGLVQVGQWLKAALPVILAVLAVIAAFALAVLLSGKLREKATAFWKRKYGDRGIARRFNSARFARALAMGLGSGLPLEEAIELAGTLMQDVPGAALRCAECGSLLADGKTLEDALSETELLPAHACRMLALGQRGGNGDQVMESVAESLMEEANEALEDKVARIEPAMVLGASILVGAILLAVMLPLMNIMSTIG